MISRVFRPQRCDFVLVAVANFKPYNRGMGLFAGVMPSLRLVASLMLVATMSIASLGAPERLQSDWPTYGFAYDNTRHSAVDRINASNVTRLFPVWRLILGPHERVETTPIVVGRTMYVTAGLGSKVIALDAVTGRVKWRYSPQIGAMSPCCGAINRGVAVENGRVFIATLDGNLVALDGSHGKPLWSVRVGNPARGFSETMAPLAWNGTVFIGSSGSDFGIRGSLSAYRASDGKRLWRWYAVSPGWEGDYRTSVNGISLHRDIAREKRNAAKYRNAWMHGGGAVWVTPALDPKTGILYASTANPAPVFNGLVRPGDNLYTNSIVALNARTGRLLWYYQELPHDIWEYEAASPPMLFDAIDAEGRHIPAVGEAGKTGWFYILNRRDGRILRLSDPLVPNRRAFDVPREEPPMIRGIVSPASYDPARHLAFTTAANRSGAQFIAAVNVDTGKITWRKPLSSPHFGVFGGVMPGSVSTPDLIFVSNPEGRFRALDPQTGEERWQYQLGSEEVDANANALQKLAHRLRDWLLPIKRWVLREDAPSSALATVNDSPIVYEIDGREYVAIGYDAQPERATGAAEISVFALR